MMLRIVVVQMVCMDRHPERGTEFQPKRRTAGWHEADGDIGTKQQRGQHDDGRHAKASGIEKPVAHTSWVQRCQGMLIVLGTTHIRLTQPPISS